MRRMGRIVCVGNKGVDDIASRPLTRDYALVPPSSLNCTIATTFGAGWLSCAGSHSVEDFSGLQPVWSAQPVDAAREEQMKKESALAYLRPLLPRSRILGCASIFLLGGLLLPALAQKRGLSTRPSR